jgi:dipeptidyl aminopeptidase/acylaminoacyl peptidase
MIETLVYFPVHGQRVVGTLCLPKGGPAPVILMLHGFTGARDEMLVTGVGEGVFSRSARRLAQQGLASFRIDFRGSGDSEGDFSDTTYEGQIADGLAALKVLASEPRVQGSKIGLLGWSQGGLAAAAVAGRSNVPLATALWAAVADPVESLGGTMGADMLAAGLKAGGVALPIHLSWKDISLKQGYFEGMLAMKPLAEVAAYNGPLFVAHGWQDEAVLPHAAAKFLAAHKASQENWMEDMDHSFNATTGPKTLDRLLDATADFFRRNGLA